jgi:hypothetical protein
VWCPHQLSGEVEALVWSCGRRILSGGRSGWCGVGAGGGGAGAAGDERVSRAWSGRGSCAAPVHPDYLEVDGGLTGRVADVVLLAFELVGVLLTSVVGLADSLD